MPESTDLPEATASQPAEPAPPPEGAVHRGSPPTLRRAGRSAAILGVLAFLALLAYLTANYSHGGPATGEKKASAATPPISTVPLSAESIEEFARRRLKERLRAAKPPAPPPDLSFPEPSPDEPPAHLTASQPARAPRRARPARDHLSAIRAPMVPSLGTAVAPRADAALDPPPPRLEAPPWDQLLPARLARTPTSGADTGAGGAHAAVPLQRRPRATDNEHSAYALTTTETRLHPDRLYAGTAVPLVLTHRLRTDVAGPARAFVTRDVYDSPTHGRVLIPRGTLVIGEQVTTAAPGDHRVLVAWHELKLPAGTSYELPTLPAGAADGSAGAPGHVDNHWWGRVGNAIALSLVGAGVQLSQPQDRSAVNGYAPDEGQIAAQQLGTELGQLSQEILRRGLERPPTITLRPGQRLTLLLTRDLVFPR